VFNFFWCLNSSGAEYHAINSLFQKRGSSVVMSDAAAYLDRDIDATDD
jgi:hypothetical protein